MYGNIQKFNIENFDPGHPFHVAGTQLSDSKVSHDKLHIAMTHFALQSLPSAIQLQGPLLARVYPLTSYVQNNVH